MFRKGALTVVLVFIFALGLTAAASANMGMGGMGGFGQGWNMGSQFNDKGSKSNVKISDKSDKSSVKSTKSSKGNYGWGNFKQKSNSKSYQFSDINSHWAQQPIQQMCSLGILSGYPNMTFAPNAYVTKYEALMMIARAKGYEPDTGSSWDEICEDLVQFARDEEILTEDDETFFVGWLPALRYEVATWAIRAMGVEEDDAYPAFLDMNQIPYTAVPYVGMMSKHNYMVGYPGNYFYPNQPVTRGEMAMILYRMLFENPDYDDDAADDEDESDELKLKSLVPKDGATNVDPDTYLLIARFNMDIQAVDDMDAVLEGISVKNMTDSEYVDIDSVSIDGDELTIELVDYLDYGCKYRVTIEKNIIESEDGDSFEGLSGSKWEFTTSEGDELELKSLDPEDGEDNVAADTTELRAVFSEDIDVVSGKDLLNAVKVYNADEEEYVDLDDVEIDGDTLVITLEDELGYGYTFEVTIKSGYLESYETGVDYEGLAGEDWSFTTEEE